MKNVSLSVAFLFGLILSSFGAENRAINFLHVTKSIAGAKKKDLFEKNVWSVIAAADSANQALFFPVNDDHNRLGFNYEKYEYDLETLEKQKSATQFNLWNILIYHFFKGEVTLHFPYDPDWFVKRDEGFLFYPITAKQYGASAKGTYFTDQKFQQVVKDFELLGYTDRSGWLVAMESTMYPGEDSINSKGEVVYYPREFIWYQDKDIIQYELRESYVFDEAGILVDKNISAIAPMSNTYDRNGNLIGLKKLFWIDFSQLKPLLANYFILRKTTETKKVLSFKDFLEQEKFTSTIVREDSVYVKLK